VAGERRQLLIEMEDRPAKAINLVDGDAIELPLGGIGHESIKGRAAGLCPGESTVHVFPGDLPVTAANVFPKLPQLHFAILVGGADTGIDGATHIIIVRYFRTFVNDSAPQS
jgi:hypothetical protein